MNVQETTIAANIIDIGVIFCRPPQTYLEIER